MHPSLRLLSYTTCVVHRPMRELIDGVTDGMLNPSSFYPKEGRRLLGTRMIPAVVHRFPLPKPVYI